MSPSLSPYSVWLAPPLDTVLSAAQITIDHVGRTANELAKAAAKQRTKGSSKQR